MPKTDLILLHAPHVYDFRKVPQIYGPVSDLVLSTPIFEMYPVGLSSISEYLEKAGFRTAISRAVWAAYQRSVELGKEKPGHIHETQDEEPQ